MLTYRIASHIPGRIRIIMPAVKKLSISDLKRLASVPVDDCIKDVSANPITGSVIIKYDPARLDIVDYLKKLIEESEFKRIMLEIASHGHGG